LLLLVQYMESVLRRCEFIRTRPNEFGPTARIRRRDLLNGYHCVGVGGANRPPPYLIFVIPEIRARFLRTNYPGSISNSIYIRVYFR